MTELKRGTSWYRPYTVTASGKEYALESIKVYDEDGKILYCRGWFEDSRGMDITSVILPVDKITRRNKVKFDGTVFGTVCHPYSGETRLNLYIPMSMINLKFIGRRKMYGDRVYNCYQGDNDIFITEYVESLNNKLTDITAKYSNLFDAVETYEMSKNPDKTIETLLQMVEVIKEFKEERANIDSMVIE